MIETRTESKTEITQLPAIYNAQGEIVALPLEILRRYNEAELLNLAKGVQGTLGYEKVEAVYTPLSHRLCNHYDCFQPVWDEGKVECDNHGTRSR